MEVFKGGRANLAPLNMEKKWASLLIITSLAFIILVSYFYTINSIFSAFSRLGRNHTTTIFVDAKLAGAPPPSGMINVPRLAYFVSGSKGDLDRLWRTLRALYHPHNLYVVHLDLKSPEEERIELSARVGNESMFAKVGNVHVIEKANMVTYRGPTMVSNTLHACAILYRMSKDWDWFINLSASDYPLVTQDDILYSFSKVPRNLNFIEHTSRLGWKEGKRAIPLIIDPGLYMKTKHDVFWVTQKRELPNAFKLFTGSAWMMLSRDFVEYLIIGYDNLPRTLLMYYTNFISTPEAYFQTVICNSPEFAPTVVNHDLHYISWDTPPQQHPHMLTIDDAPKMVKRNVPFARKFNRNDPVLDKIDVELLGRMNGSFVPGGWCGKNNKMCTKVKDERKLRPGPGSRRLARLLNKLVSSDWFTQINANENLKNLEFWVDIGNRIGRFCRSDCYMTSVAKCLLCIHSINEQHKVTFMFFCVG